MITDDSVETFLNRLASADPTPGGGSAAAIMGAMGAGLVSMVCNVTLGKKGYESTTAELESLLAETERLRANLTSLVAEDVSVFDDLMAAYRLPKSSDAEKAERSSRIQQSLRRATEVPLDCARSCAEVVKLAQRSAELGFRGVVSDAGVGALVADAALNSAALNVYINTPSIMDRHFGEAAQAEIIALVEATRVLNADVQSSVRARIAG